MVPHGLIGRFRETSRELSEIAGRMYGTPEARKELTQGAGGDITVELDRVLEEVILSHFPDFRIISEERGIVMGGDAGTIICDPLDGSHNAKFGLPLFSVSLAYTPKMGNFTLGDIEAGYVLDLLNGNEFYALKGEGLFHNGKMVVTDAPLKPGEAIDIFAFEEHCSGKLIKHYLPFFQNTERIRCLGSMALDLAFTASGVFDVFLDLCGSRLLDITAGIVLIEEGGGVITDTSGNSISGLNFSISEKTTILAASTPARHNFALSLTKST